MPNVLVQDTSLRGIADAIRNKNKSSLTYKPADMAAAINSLPTGGSSGNKLGPFKGEEMAPAKKEIGSQGLGFFEDLNVSHPILWNYFKETLFTDSLIDKEKGLTNCERMFAKIKLEEIPITIYFNTNNCSFFKMFSDSPTLKQPPLLRAVGVRNNDRASRNLHSMFYGCVKLEEIPENWLDWEEWKRSLETDHIFWNNICPFFMFYGCCCLKSIPQGLLELFQYTVGMTKTFGKCESLEKIENMGYPLGDKYESTYSKGPIDIFKSNYKLTKFTFKNNGPTLLNQTVLNMDACGFDTGSWGPECSDFTQETKVKDAATYQTLKNQNYWTRLPEYSRYNHTSMVETINSLPEIIKIGSEKPVNTIKFRATQGDSTDEGGASNLTEEEMAVASAKGWTVSII